MSVIVSRGEAKSWPFGGTVTKSGPSAGLVSLLRADGAARSFDGMFAAQPMVFAVVRKRVKAVARLPLKAYEFGHDGHTRARVRTGELPQLLAKPWPGGSPYAMKAAIAYGLDVHGKALLWKYRRTAGAPPSELWPIPWRHVGVIRDERGPIGYVLHIGGKQFNVGPEDVIHFEDVGGGVSPLEPLRRTLALDDASMDYSATAMGTGTTGGRVVFRTDQKLQQAALDSLREELAKAYSGPENAGRPIVVDQGLDARAMNVSASDMELVAQRKLSREEVCAVYDTAPALFGLEQSSWQNVGEFRKALYDSVASTLTLIEDTMAAHLIGSEPSWDGLFVEFDANDLLRIDLEGRARAHMLMQQAGISTRNEARQVENLPPIDDPLADTVFVPLNMAPLDGSGVLPDATTRGTPMQGIGDAVTTIDATTP